MHNLLLLSIDGFIHNNRGLLITIFIGAVAGLIAQFLTPGKGFGMITTVIIGIVGGWLGSLLFKNYLSFTDSALVNAIICATAGAIILCLLINLVVGTKGKRADRTNYRA